MNTKLSRRKIASYAAQQIVSGESVSQTVDAVAAYLIESGRIRETELVARAIEDELARRGHVVARVTTAEKLDLTLDESIAKITSAKKVYVDTIVDPDVIGGVIIETPDKKLDASIRSKLNALRRAKI